MNTLVMLVALAGGGMFAYRQWKAIRADAQPPRTERFPNRAERIGGDEPPAYTICVGPEIVPSLEMQHQSAPPRARPKINKWLLFSLAILYVVCPLDFDFIPIGGWVDDAIVMFMSIKALLDKNR
jgi:Protein of unknown function (DUF1232)